MKQKFKDLFSKKNWPHAKEIHIQTDYNDLPVGLLARAFLHDWEGLVLIVRLTEVGRLEMSLSPCVTEYRGVVIKPDNEIEITTGNYDFSRNPDTILKAIQKRIEEGNTISDAVHSMDRSKDYIDGVIERGRRARKILGLPEKSDREIYYEQENGVPGASQTRRARAVTSNKQTMKRAEVGTLGELFWVTFDNLTEEQSAAIVDFWEKMQ